MKFALLMGLSVAMLIGCNVSANKTDAAAGDTEKGSPQATVEQYAQALAKNDVDTAINLYAPEVFKMEGIAEAQARQIMAEQLRNQEVPVFANGAVKVGKVTRYAQVDYTVGGKVRHLLLKETPEGWRISNSMIAE